MDSAKKATKNKYEKERGKPLPSLDHGLTQTNLIFLLGKKYFPKFTFASELDLLLSGRSATPDICIYQKMKRVIGNQPDILKLEEAPLTTIEILSPTQTLSELTNKIKELYFPNGVKSAWVVLPEFRAVAIFENGKDDHEYFKSGKLNDPVTGIELDVEEVFRV